MLVLELGILRSEEVRSQPFNLYLIFLYIPSLIYIGKLIADVIRTLSPCYVPGPFPNIWAFSFYFPANILMNAVIAHDVYGLLRSSKKCLRIRPLPLKTIYVRVAVIYLVSVGNSIWRTFDEPDSRDSPRVEYWIVSCSLFLGAIFYVFYICIRVWKGKLLPLNGETRALAFFFLRIATIFLIVWVPVFVIFETFLNGSPEIRFFVPNYLAIGGEIISVAFAMTKPDVRHSVKIFLRCEICNLQRFLQRRQPGSEEPSEQTSSTEPAVEGSRICGWHRPDDFGDDIVRQRYSSMSSSNIDRGNTEDARS